MAAKSRRERYAICRPGSSTFSVEHFPQPRRRRFRAAALGCIEERKSILGGRVMKNGLRVYDADTHVEPSAEVIDKYVDPGFRPRLEELAPYRMPVRAGSPGSSPGRHVYRYGQISYKRILGEAVPRETHSGRETHWMGSKQPRPGAQPHPPSVPTSLSPFPITLRAARSGAPRSIAICRSCTTASLGRRPISPATPI